jgi:uncharacterized protein (TIGR02118 family)
LLQSRDDSVYAHHTAATLTRSIGRQGGFMVKLVVLYGHPKSAADFEKYYADTHIPIAGQMKDVRNIELSKVSGTPDGGKAPFYRMAELSFDNHDHMRKVLATPEAQKTVADLANFATGGVTVMVVDTQ